MSCEVREMKCKRCGSARIKKNGFREGKQCYYCHDCRHQFISEMGRHTPQEEKIAVLLYCLGLSFTVIAQVLFYHPSTIMRWVRKYAQGNCRKPIPRGEIVIELDEMWHFVRSKKTRCGFGRLTVAQPENSWIGNSATEA
jgi:transposase-like protein